MNVKELILVLQDAIEHHPELEGGMVLDVDECKRLFAVGVNPDVRNPCLSYITLIFEKNDHLG